MYAFSMDQMTRLGEAQAARFARSCRSIVRAGEAAGVPHASDAELDARVRRWIAPLMDAGFVHTGDLERAVRLIDAVRRRGDFVFPADLAVTLADPEIPVACKLEALEQMLLFP